MPPPDRTDSLRTEWTSLLGAYGVTPADATPPFDVLLAAHTAPERHYHNLEHLTEMFEVAARFAPDVADYPALRLAIWFHDAVYDPRAKDNEARSGELAVDLLGPIGVPASTIERVVRLVRSTAHPSSDDPPGDRDTATLLDADLAILAAREDRYRRYAADVRKEYGFLSDAEYRTGRAAVLRKFLARPRIFLCPLMFDECEARARANISAELAESGG